MESNESFSELASKVFAKPASGHVSLGKPLRASLFLVPTGLVGWYLYSRYGLENIPVVVTFAIVAVLYGVATSGVRVAAQWEKGVILRFGKFHAVRGPGILYVVPIMDYVRFIDTRVLALNIPSQKVITKDNVPAKIDGVLYFRVDNAESAVIKIQDFRFAIAQYAQASLRDVVGGLSLDELLTEREQIQERIGQMVEEHIKEWGVRVDSIRLLDISMPEELERMMSRQASAEREKRATITKAEGDKMAAFNLSEAANTMRKNPGAMQLRTLQTIDGLGPNPSNTVVLFPVELTEALEELGRFLRERKGDDQTE